MVRLLFSKLSRQELLLPALHRRKQTYPSNSCTTLSIPSDLLMTLELDPHEQQARADYIEYLYRLSGRTNRLYTGLYQARVKELIARDRYAAVNTNHPAHEIEPPPPPPPELVEQWYKEASKFRDFGYTLQRVATQAAQWGADQEKKNN